jgi:hypothetical protein
VLFLGIDTATRVGSVGLVRAAIEDGDVVASEPGRIADGCETLAEVSRDTGLGHGIELLPLIDECLACANVSLEDVACIAVSIGPGSFTGLRVALATAKGLALGGTATLVGVPTLEAYAASVLPGWGADEDALAAGTLVAACLDARKGARPDTRRRSRCASPSGMNPRRVWSGCHPISRSLPSASPPSSPRARVMRRPSCSAMVPRATRTRSRMRSPGASMRGRSRDPIRAVRPSRASVRECSPPRDRAIARRSCRNTRARRRPRSCARSAARRPGHSRVDIRFPTGLQLKSGALRAVDGSANGSRAASGSQEDLNGEA